MTDIFGRSWEEIQAMQQGTFKPKLIDPTQRARPNATATDLELLEKLGMEGLKERKLWGVLDRLGG